MGKVLKRLAKRDQGDSEEALGRLDEATAKGPEALQRFIEATRRFVKVRKDAASPKRGS
jgi:hypothetical protein